MSKHGMVSFRSVLLVSGLIFAVLAATAGSPSGSAAQPFPVGTVIEGNHPDALLSLHNLGTGLSLRAYSEGGGAAIRAESSMADGVIGVTDDPDKAGVFGWSIEGVGVTARSDKKDGVVGWTGSQANSAVLGNSTAGIGVKGTSSSNYGVRGTSVDGVGVSARSTTNDGMVGTTADNDKSGVFGWSTEGVGVTARSDENDGLVGWTGDKDRSGVWGNSTVGTGVTGSSEKTGVHGTSTTGTGVLAQSAQGTALLVQGTSIFKNYASFQGGHGDLAENYYGSGHLEGGDVVVIDAGGGMTLRAASKANDTAVAGIVSTAPSMKLQGLIADDQGIPLVLAGRTLCKVDASYGAIAPGDLLTSSSTPGYAMKAQPISAGGAEFYRPGTIIGKALEAWEEGQGLIEVLVTLQ